VYSRLSRRLRETGHKSFASYLQWLESSTGPSGAQEWQEFVNCLTTNLTSFFREEHHFHALKDDLKPFVGKPVRIWCCAASTGEEPYSILMTCSEALGANASVQLVASDIDTNVLARHERNEEKPAEGSSDVTDGAVTTSGPYRYVCSSSTESSLPRPASCAFNGIDEACCWPNSSTSTPSTPSTVASARTTALVDTGRTPSWEHTYDSAHSSAVPAVSDVAACRIECAQHGALLPVASAAAAANAAAILPGVRTALVTGDKDDCNKQTNKIIQ